MPPKPSVLETIAGVAGNVLEWYDFAIFGYFSDTIALVFFPPEAGDLALIESFTVFWAAFLMRPFGGAFIGYIGDLYGRKRALVFSIFLMAFPTFAMGCLPTYAMAGPWAIVLLVIVRCLQGLSVGGQLMSSLVFTVENYPKEEWGLWGSIVMATANSGTLLGSLIAALLNAVLTEDQLESWGWRIPFWAGILISGVGLYLRYYGNIGYSALPEDSNIGSGNPFKLAFREGNRRMLFASILVSMTWPVTLYVGFVWMATYMADLIANPMQSAFLVNSLALFLSVCLLFPIGGIISDRVGRKPVMIVGGTCNAILSPLLIVIIGRGKPVGAFFSQFTMGIFLSLWGGPMMAWLAEAFPPDVRLSSMSLGYNIAQASLGGSSPALATWFVDAIGPDSPGLLLTFASLLSLFGLLVVAPSPPSLVAPEDEAPKEETSADPEQADEGTTLPLVT